MVRQRVKAMCNPLYEVLQDGEPVYATANLETAKDAYFNRVKEAESARVELVENVSNRPDFNLKKLTHPSRCKRYERIMYYDPFEIAK